MAPVLEIVDLRVTFSTSDGVVPATHGVSLQVSPGETLGLVGESGCGKSVTALAAMRLLPPAGQIAGGRVILDGIDMSNLGSRELRRLRGQKIAMVFQDSSTSLNPVVSVGRQLTESLSAHRGLTGRQAGLRAVELLEEVGVPDPSSRLRQYPHQLSGGLRQRVAVAVALAANPDVLIADEPTTALDVTIQAQLLELLRREQSRRAMALILITHDLGAVAQMADRLAVMYAGRIVEEGPADNVFAAPAHPYTEALLASVPRLDAPILARLPTIQGTPPRPTELDGGCPFRPRCRYAFDRCVEEPPLEETDAAGRSAACWLRNRSVA